MPTASAVLNFSRSDREMLGGWSAEGSERYSRAGKFKITSMQQAVSSTFKNPDHDPLAEADGIDLLGQFLKSWDVQDEEVLLTTFTDVQKEEPSEVPAGDVVLFLAELLADGFLNETATMEMKIAKDKQQSWNRARSDVSGEDHKQSRIAIRAELEAGYHISGSRKKGIKVLHGLGQRCMLPGVDYMNLRLRRYLFPWIRFVRNVLQVVRKVEEFLGQTLGLLVPTPPRQVRRRSDSRSSWNSRVRSSWKLQVLK